MLFAKVAKMPGPEETLGKDDQAGSEDSEADPRRGVTKRIASAGEENERQVAEPAESDEGSNHEKTSVLQTNIQLSGRTREDR